MRGITWGNNTPSNALPKNISHPLFKVSLSFSHS